MENHPRPLSRPYHPLDFARDIPNICSLTGLFCSVLSIYLSLSHHFSPAVIAMLWAVFFDYCDGMIARRMKQRPEIFGTFGQQLDSLIDIVSFGACPAVFLLSYGKFSPLLLPVVFCILASNALRLSYFNLFGLTEDGSYMGLSLDNNIFIFAFVFLFEGLFSPSLFVIILSFMFIGLSLLNLSHIATPKYQGKGFYLVVAYIMVLTLIHGQDLMPG
ncbi:MAG: CDP-alcohol phosphatidyltransferase [Desulfobacteraceae bacterium]|nr:CDP-alcohol phosphatidyltransferase [Desulfobacteraceae bacterium]